MYLSSGEYLLSRADLQLYLDCRRCFFRKLTRGIKKPKTFPLSMNDTVDLLLKKEFDLYRERKEPHPVSRGKIPFSGPEFERFREPFGEHFGPPKLGARIPETNFYLYGALDDIWTNPEGELHIVEYKSKGKEPEPYEEIEYCLPEGVTPPKRSTLPPWWPDQYCRQVDIYHYLLTRVTKHKVSKTAYFLLVYAKREEESFNFNLKFGYEIYPYEVNTDWIESKVQEAFKLVNGSTPPPSSSNCESCKFLRSGD